MGASDEAEGQRTMGRAGRVPVRCGLLCKRMLLPSPYPPYQPEFSQSLPHNLHVTNFRWMIVWLGDPGSYACVLAGTELGKCYLMFSVHYGRRTELPVF